ncbi:hypothetical protein AB3M80_21425 [Arthrospira platensis BEA 1257B]
MGANLNPIKSLFLTSLYSVASIIPLAIITSGGKSMAQRIPDRCILPRSFVNQPLPRGGGQPAPVQPD